LSKLDGGAHRFFLHDRHFSVPAWPFVFYCLTVKIGTLGKRPLLAQSGRSHNERTIEESQTLCRIRAATYFAPRMT